MDEKGFYSLDKVFTRIIEGYPHSYSRQKLPPQHVQIYSKVWNSFSKWCRTQLEQDRIVLASDTSNFPLTQSNSPFDSFPTTTPASTSSP